MREMSCAHQIKGTFIYHTKYMLSVDFSTSLGRSLLLDIWLYFLAATV